MFDYRDSNFFKLSWIEQERKRGHTHHHCLYGNHMASLDRFEEDHYGTCLDCLPVMQEETRRQEARHQIWLAWTKTREGKIVALCNEVLDAEKMIDYADDWGVDDAINTFNAKLGRLQRILGLKDEAYQYARDHANDGPPIR